MRSFKISKFSVIVSISLVLFLAGIFSLLMLYTNSIANNIRENLAVTLVLKEGSGYAQMITIENEIKNETIVKKLEFISAQKAAEMLQKDLGEDFISVIGYNPLLPMVEIYIKSEFADSKSVDALANKFKSHPLVKEVKVQNNLLLGLESMTQKITLAFFALLILLLVVVFSLIHQSIRLSIYSQRFTIKTLQLVGARPWYIRKPFLINSSINGFIGGLIGVVFLLIIIFVARENIPGLKSFDNYVGWAILSLGLIVSGILIAFFSTIIVVRKFLNYDLDQIYLK